MKVEDGAGDTSRKEDERSGRRDRSHSRDRDRRDRSKDRRDRSRDKDRDSECLVALEGGGKRS